MPERLKIRVPSERVHEFCRRHHIRRLSFFGTQIVGMRHHLAHVYFDIDLDRLWTTVTDDLPPLVAALERILARPTG